MKRLLVLALVCLAVVSCTKDDDDDNHEQSYYIDQQKLTQDLEAISAVIRNSNER